MSQKFMSLKGKLLLDSGELMGSFFHQSAVYICEHDEEGAVGLVLNHPASVKLSDVLVLNIPEVFHHSAVKMGGPVMQKSIFCLLHSQVKKDSFREVVPTVYLTPSIEDIFEDDAPESVEDVHFFLGYAGWSAGQLEEEIARKAWLISTVRITEIFQKEPPFDLWKDRMYQLGGKYRFLAMTPRNLYDN